MGQCLDSTAQLRGAPRLRAKKRGSRSKSCIDPLLLLRRSRLGIHPSCCCSQTERHRGGADMVSSRWRIRSWSRSFLGEACPQNCAQIQDSSIYLGAPIRRQFVLTALLETASVHLNADGLLWDPESDCYRYSTCCRFCPYRPS